jgi:hypothetical protein
MAGRIYACTKSAGIGLIPPHPDPSPANVRGKRGECIPGGSYGRDDDLDRILQGFYCGFDAGQTVWQRVILIRVGDYNRQPGIDGGKAGGKSFLKGRAVRGEPPAGSLDPTGQRCEQPFPDGRLQAFEGIFEYGFDPSQHTDVPD